MKNILSILLIVVFPGIISGQGKFFGGNGDGFATATISNQVLPLVIQNFDGQLEKDKGILNFTISSDELICGIVIEKSQDGTSYVRMDSINLFPGAYLAEKVSRQDNVLFPGNNYYRLRIQKCSGALVYSKVILLYVPLRNTFYYSSADRRLYYYLSKPGNILVYNSLGQVMFNQKVQPGSGSILMNMPSTGFYVYKFEDLPSGKFMQ